MKKDSATNKQLHEISKLLPCVLLCMLLCITIVPGCVEKNIEEDNSVRVVKVNRDISSYEASFIINKNQKEPNFVILDLRTQKEYLMGFIPRAINVDYQDMNFEYNLDKLDRDKTYLIYCKTGIKSMLVRHIMDEMNFTSVYNLQGGIDAWEDAGLAVKKT
ncbi:MAG: rhodanese-like domain-containing protein [Euryarchaeota archaeon]|nr:rhodanese-like domain-containing protein [Euryarchaeota archaeon]